MDSAGVRVLHLRRGHQRAGRAARWWTLHYSGHGSAAGDLPGSAWLVLGYVVPWTAVRSAARERPVTVDRQRHRGSSGWWPASRWPLRRPPSSPHGVHRPLGKLACLPSCPLVGRGCSCTGAGGVVFVSLRHDALPGSRPRPTKTRRTGCRWVRWRHHRAWPARGSWRWPTRRMVDATRGLLAGSPLVVFWAFRHLADPGAGGRRLVAGIVRPPGAAETRGLRWRKLGPPRWACTPSPASTFRARGLAAAGARGGRDGLGGSRSRPGRSCWRR